MTTSSDSIINVQEGWAIVNRAKAGNIVGVEEEEGNWYERWAIDNRAKKHKIIDMENGWAIIYNAILQLGGRLEEDVNFQVTADEIEVIDIIVSYMCEEHYHYVSDKYIDSINDYIFALVSPPLLEQNDDQLLLIEVVKRWNIYKAMLHWMDVFFRYLDLRFSKSVYMIHSVREVGIMYFRAMFFRKIQNNVKNAVIILIDEEREGKTKARNETLLKDIVSVFVEVDMNFYTNDFEVAMLEHNGDFYSLKAALWILEGSYTNYMSRLHESLIHEKERVARYLHGRSEQKVLDTVKMVLFSRYVTHLLEDEHSGCLALLREHRYDELLMMGSLFDTVPNGWESIANIFKQHVTSEVTPLVKQAEDVVKQNAGRMDKRLLLQEVSAFVRKVIELRDQYMKYAEQNTAFSRALKEVFEVFCKKEIAGSTSAEWLATLCDTVLKENSSNEKLSGDDIIENVVEFIEHIWDKYLFVESYREKLTRRILFGKSVNVGHEQRILSKLKQKCGHPTMLKIAGMLTDWRRSKERQSEFENYLKNNGVVHLGIEFTVTVLTTGFLQTYKCPQISLPSEMVRCVEAFKNYYSVECPHQQLKWIHSLGSCTIIGRFDRRSIKIIATTCQTAILLLFNASEKLSYSNIKKKLNLAEEEIDGLLYSLACDKYKILLKIPDTTMVTTSDDFKINCKRGKIKLPMPFEKKKSPEDINNDKRFLIDASIVRIVKAKKLLQYKILVSECAQELEGQFKLDFIEVKRRIEDLIEREF